MALGLRRPSQSIHDLFHDYFLDYFGAFRYTYYMTNRIMLGMLLMVLTGCGQAPQQDPAFLPIVAQFTQDAFNHGIVLQVSSKMQFGDVVAMGLPEGTVGVCVRNTVDEFDLGTITIDPVHWKVIPPLEQKMLVYHELGHCVLNRSHVMGVEQVQIYPGISVTEQLPLSIMYPSSPDEGQLDLGGTSYQAALINEMFGG